MWTEIIFFKKHLSLQHGIIIYRATKAKPAYDYAILTDVVLGWIYQ